jgi:hypothetical protein
MTYEEFEKHMAEKYPRYCGADARFGGYAIGEGWYPIIEQLIAEIDHYTQWKRRTRAYDLLQHRAFMKGRDALIKFVSKGKENPTDWEIDRAEQIMENMGCKVTPKVHWITIDQIKEKFGGLRFYYSGGDEQIHGMVRMAEIWAGRTCEKCGNKGERRHGGWMRTLCDEHEAEHQEKLKNMRSEDDDV